MTTPTVSGPGALSRRTDTGPTQKLRDLPDADYGENATYKDLQQSAGLGQSAGTLEGGGGGRQPVNVTPIDAPTMQPGTPVTDGANAGAGMSADALGIVPQQDQDLDALLVNLPVWEYIANLPNASWAMRNMVRRLKGRV